jgi:hypothetical protein
MRCRFYDLFIFVCFAACLVACGGTLDERWPDDQVGSKVQALSSCVVSSIAFGTWYSQNDSSWDDELLGNSSAETIGDSGCVITSLAMAYHNTWSTSTTPLQLNDSAVDDGCFGPGSPAVNVGCAINSRGGPHSVVDLSTRSDMASAICSGYPVMVNVYYGGNPDAHKMLVYYYTGGTTSSDSSYYAVDPWTGNSIQLGASPWGASTRWRKLQ